MNDTPDSFEMLVAYAMGELDATTRQAIESRLAGSSTMRENLKAIRKVIETLAEDDTVTPQEHVVQRVISLVRQRQQSQTTSALERTGLIIARLIFDSRAQPALPGFRGTGAGYHLMFVGEIGEVDLQIVPQAASGASRLQVRGQVSNNESAATLVRLARRGSDRKPHLIQPDQQGTFRFEAESGQYDLEIDLGQQTLLVEDIRLT